MKKQNRREQSRRDKQKAAKNAQIRIAHQKHAIRRAKE